VSAVTNEMNNQLTNTLVNATRQRSEGNLTRPLDLSVIDRWTWASDDEKNRWKVNFANFNTSLMVPEEVIDNGASQIVSDANFNELMILAERDQQEFGYKLNEYYTQGTITDAQYRTLLNSKEDGIFNVLRFSEMEPQLEAYMDSMGIRDSNYDSVMSQVNTLARRFVQDQLLSYEPGSNQPPLTSELVSDYMKNQIAIINGRTITSMGNVLNRTMGLGLTYSTRTNRDALAVSREIADGHRFYSIGNDPQEAETMKVFYQNHEDLRRGFNTVLFGATQLSEDFNNAETEIDPSTGYPIQKIYTQGRPYLENSRYAGTSNYGTSMIVTRMVPGIANDPVTGQWTLEVWNPQNERWENGSQGFLAEQRWVSPSQVRGTGSTNTSPPQRTRDPEQAARGGFVEDAPATTGPSIWIMGVEVKGGVIDDLIYNSW